MEDDPLLCSICRDPIPVKHGWAGGNNAQPINNGRCCDVCNMTRVVPARLRAMQEAIDGDH